MVLEQKISPKNVIFFTPSSPRLASPDGVITPLTPSGSIAGEEHEKCTHGHLSRNGIFHFDTLGTWLGQRCTRGEQEVFTISARGGTRGAREVHRLNFLRPIIY